MTRAKTDNLTKTDKQIISLLSENEGYAVLIEHIQKKTGASKKVINTSINKLIDLDKIEKKPYLLDLRKCFYSLK